MACNPTTTVKRMGFTASLAALTASMMLPLPAAAATRPITFDVSLHSSCVAGRASDNATVNWRWKNAAGGLVASGAVVASASGRWYLPCSAHHVIEPAHRLVASDGHSTHRFVVPDLTMRLNRVGNAIKGTGPAGTKLTLEYLFPGLPHPDVALSSKRITINDEGRWSFRPRSDISGGDGAFMTWSNTHRDSVSLSAEAPFLTVTLGSSRFTGVARHNTTAYVALRDGVTDAVKGTGMDSVWWQQEFAGNFRNGDNERVSVVPGDRVWSDIASDAEWIVPDIEVSGDAATETVSGRCHDTGRSAELVQIKVYRDGIRRGWDVLGTESDGSFAQDMEEVWFPDPSVVKHGDRLLVSCMQKNGDWVQIWSTVP